MTESLKKHLEQQLWNIANDLRGKINADEFRDYCLGFIFYKYLSDKLHLQANTIMDGDDFADIDENSADGKDMLQTIKDESVTELGYFLKPSELFSSLAKRATDAEEFILGDITNVLNGHTLKLNLKNTVLFKTDYLKVILIK